MKIHYLEMSVKINLFHGSETSASITDLFVVNIDFEKIKKIGKFRGVSIEYKELIKI